MIRQCGDADFEGIWSIINDGASAYEGVIPADCWHTPYMSKAELLRQIEEGVAFWGYEDEQGLAGVMGLQRAGDVDLIRHAYVLSRCQHKGIGSLLLSHLLRLAERPVLIGTWAAAVWAIRFYEKHGFRVVTPEQKESLLRKYWNIPDRQIDTSVVLADSTWRE